MLAAEAVAFIGKLQHGLTAFEVCPVGAEFYAIARAGDGYAFMAALSFATAFYLCPALGCDVARPRVKLDWCRDSKKLLSTHSRYCYPTGCNDVSCSA